MNLREKFSKTGYVVTDWRRLLIRGSLMLLIGVGLVIATIFKPDVIIMQVRDFSWLPVCGFVVLAVGLLECFDAAIAKKLEDFFLNLQNGVLDVVVAGLIIFSIGDDPARLSLLITAFLIVKGIFRLTLAYIPQRYLISYQHQWARLCQLSLACLSGWNGLPRQVGFLLFA